MKLLFVIIIFAWLVSVCALPVSALTSEDVAEEIGTEGLRDAVPESASEVMDGVSASQLQDTDELFSRLEAVIRRESKGILASALGSAGAMLTVAVLCSAAEAVWRHFHPDGKDG